VDDHEEEEEEEEEQLHLPQVQRVEEVANPGEMPPLGPFSVRIVPEPMSPASDASDRTPNT
jgi:hypothetical protein